MKQNSESISSEAESLGGSDTSKPINALLKLFRFACIYGIRRALFKAAGRKRILNARVLAFNLRSKEKDVGGVGCGQFAFATIGGILEISTRHRFVAAYDIDANAQNSLEKFYQIEKHFQSFDELLSNEKVKYLYIASSHSSHTDYAIRAIEQQKQVYIEKPVSVNWDQFHSLSKAIENASQPVYFGYNRPFSGAVRQLREMCSEVSGPISLSFFVCGHLISSDHWYRQPGEGTRVCGNMGHWIDLTVHMLSWKRLARNWEIRIHYSDSAVMDDNVSVSLSSENGDLVHLILTARSEPYEGINESVTLQWGDVIAKINDFRTMEVWSGASRNTFRYWPKDVGHKMAITQPFYQAVNRWSEVKASTQLMLTIKDMVESKIESAAFSFEQ